MNPSHTTRGTAVSLAASCLFGLIYYYATVLKPLTGLEIYGWRILFTVPCLSLFMMMTGFWPLVGGIMERLKARPALVLPLLLSSFLLGIQLWLFMWAPINGMALDVSLGYLLMPLAMVLCGRCVYQERLKLFQRFAVCCAAVGVGNQLWQVGSLSWAVLVVTLGFPLYFMLRRKLGTDHLGGLWFDMTFMVPVALGVIVSTGSPWTTLTEHPALFALIPLLGVLSASATGLYILASRLLPLGLFGLLSYVEPVLLVGVSLLLGESVKSGEGLTYVGVGTAVTVLALGGVQALYTNRRT